MMSILAFISFQGLSWLTAKKESYWIHLLLHTIHFARQEAIHSQETVYFRAITSCSSDWSGDLYVFSPSKKLIQLPSFPSSLRLQSNRPCGFTFTSHGYCETPGTLTLHTPEKIFSIIINNSGRPKVESICY